MLRAENLCLSFGALRVTDNVSLSVPPGVRHAIIGPNGAGKTTLFNLLTGELTPTSGRVFIGDKDVTRAPPNQRARLGLSRTFQKNNFFPSATVRDNLLLADIAARGTGWHFWRKLKDDDAAHARAEATAGRVGLSTVMHRLAKALSYGAQRQLEVGLALITNPEILILDEPTSGMSPLETGRMMEFVDQLPRSLAVVIIEHDMDLVFGHADVISVLNYGEILMQGTVDEVRGSQVVQEIYLGAGGEDGPC